MYIDYLREAKKFTNHKHLMPPEAKPPAPTGPLAALNGDSGFKNTLKQRKKFARRAEERAGIMPTYMRKTQIRAIQEDLGLA